MSKLKRIALLAVPIVLLTLVAVADVVRFVGNVEFGGGEYVREALVLGSFLLLYWFLHAGRKRREAKFVRAMGKLLIQLIVILFLAGLLSVFQSASRVPVDLRDASMSAVGRLQFFAFAEILALGIGMFILATLLELREFIFHKRRKGTFRNFLMYIIGMLLGSLLAFKPLDVIDSTASVVLTVYIFVMMVVISFRQNWIVYLSRREKLFALVYSVFLFVGFILLNVFVRGENVLVRRALLEFSSPLLKFVQLNAIFGAVYFGMSAVSTLFHLPTAEVYERKQSELSSLHNLSRLVSQVLDFPDLVNTVTTMTLEVCGAKSAWLELVRGTPGTAGCTIDVVSRKNITMEQIDALTKGESTSIREIVHDSKKVLLIDNAASDRRLNKKKTKLRIGTIICVPLLSHSEPIGYLYGLKEEEFGFDQDDIDVLTTFADHVAIAIENSKLIARSLERERFQQEIMLAQKMQHRLLPQSMPRYPGVDIAAACEMSMEVGGDYYDFVYLDDTRFGIVTGDVSGKGVSAAFYMAEAKGIFQSLSKFGLSPREFVVRANQTVTGSLDKKSFISLLYAVIDTARGEMKLARAGHCPLVYVSNGTGTLVRPEGMGLGLTVEKLFETSIEEARLTLRAGDVCIFYTDGVTEARSAEGEEFGYQRLIDLVTAHRQRGAEEIKNVILAEVRAFSHGSSFSDDLTLVVMKWDGTPAEPAHTRTLGKAAQDGAALGKKEQAYNE